MTADSPRDTIRPDPSSPHSSARNRLDSWTLKGAHPAHSFSNHTSDNPNSTSERHTGTRSTRSSIFSMASVRSNSTHVPASGLKSSPSIASLSTLDVDLPSAEGQLVVLHSEEFEANRATLRRIASLSLDHGDQVDEAVDVINGDNDDDGDIQENTIWAATATATSTSHRRERLDRLGAGSAAPTRPTPHITDDEPTPRLAAPRTSPSPRLLRTTSTQSIFDTPAIAPLDDESAAVEAASQLNTYSSCAVCSVQGVNLPKCPRCGLAFCSRVCRVGEAGAGDGKRHVCGVLERRHGADGA